MKQKLHASQRLNVLILFCCMLIGNMSRVWADNYTLVKSTNDLSQGDVIIITSGTDGTVKALGTQNSNNRAAVDLTINNETISSLGQASEIVLYYATTSGFNLKDGDNYLYAANTTNGKNNYLKSSSTKDNVYWSIAINSTSFKATIIDYVSDCNGRKYLRFNNSSSLFSCYAEGSQNDVYVFKKVTTPSSAAATSTTIDATGITNTDVYTSTAAGSLSASVTADGTAVEGATVTWSSSDDNVATIDANGAVTLVAAGTVTFTASYAGVSGEYQASSDTYEMTVTSSAPAEILDYTSLGLENAEDLGTQHTENFSATAAKGSNTNNSPKYYTSDNTARFYSGNTLTISSTTNKKIAKIEFNVNVDATVNTGSLTDNIWIGSATTVEFTMPKVSIKTIKVTFENENLNDPELSFSTTEFNVEAGAVFTAPTLTNPHSLQVTYSSSNTDIATVNETTGAVTIGNIPGTVTITATFEGNDVYSYGSASYTITVSAVLSNIAALTALEEGGEYQVHLTDALVTYIHGNNAYLEDASGAVLLFGCAEGFAVGDKINGTATVEYTLFYKLPEVTTITLAEGYTKTSGNVITPTEITIATLNNDYNSYISRYVKIVDATVTSAFSNRNATIAQGEATIALRDQNNPGSLSATKDDIVTVTAHPTIYNTTKQIAVYEQSQIVVKPVEKINPKILVEDESIVFGGTYTIDDSVIEGGEITVTSGNTAVATVNGLVITPVAVGSVEITVATAESNRYNAGSETFTLTVTQPEGQTEAQQESSAFSLTTIFKDKNLGYDEGMDWGATIDATAFESSNDARGVQFGAAKGEFSLSSLINQTVTKVSIVMSTNGAGNTFAVTVGDNAFTSTYGDLEEPATTISLESGIKNETLEFNGTGTGNIVISINDKVKSVWIKSITISGEESSAPTITYNIPSSGVGTYCNKYPLDLSATALPSDVKAYAVESQTETSVTLAEITSPVKGGTGFIIKATGETKTVNFTSVDCSTTPEGNKLVGTLAPTYVAANTVYGMKNGEFHPNNAGNIPANRAYLPAEEGTPVKALTLIFKDADGITETRTITDAQTIFDLTGRRLQNMQKGVNIVGGKKVLVK